VEMRRNLGACPRLKELLQPLVPDVPYHLLTVTR
jgi:hypothetical protein